MGIQLLIQRYRLAIAPLPLVLAGKAAYVRVVVAGPQVVVIQAVVELLTGKQIVIICVAG
ncbi:hypothetical protein ORJ00_01295 [Rheinheimera baltica]|nr:hypothetical protein [Rheinheimera baltica]MDP5141373.1 hypothetical protein [Rheinheimera baltica]